MSVLDEFGFEDISAPPGKYRATFSKTGLLVSDDNSMYVDNYLADFGGTLGLVSICTGDTEIEAVIKARRGYYGVKLRGLVPGR